MARYKFYKVFGGNLPLIVVEASNDKKALCFARRINIFYCFTLQLDKNNIDQSPAVNEKTKFFSCLFLCKECKTFRFYFWKKSCRVDNFFQSRCNCKIAELVEGDSYEKI